MGMVWAEETNVDIEGMGAAVDEKRVALRPCVM